MFKEIPNAIRNRRAENQLACQVDGVFIRAPLITRTGPGVAILASIDNAPVLVRQGRQLAASFHPELTNSAAVHRYFIDQLVKA